MKKVKGGLLILLAAGGLMGYLGYDFLVPLTSYAKEEKAVKEEKATAGASLPKEAKKTAKQAPTAKAKALPAVVTVVTPVCTLAKKLGVPIVGTGYSPDEELLILFTDAEGMQTNIAYALEPPLQANKAGAWSTTWLVDDFVKARLVAPGVFTLTVTDKAYKPLAQAAIAFKEAAKQDTGEKKGEKGEKKGEKGEKKAEAK